jgi:hypothetical protein
MLKIIIGGRGDTAGWAERDDLITGTYDRRGVALPISIRYEWLMGILGNWKRKRFKADVRKYRQQEEKRELIVEWYRVLKPFHAKGLQLEALADDLSENAIHSVVGPFIFVGGAWTVILVLLYWFTGLGRRDLLWLGPLGYIGIVAFLFRFMKDEMRRRLRDYANGYWVAHDPFTGEEIYPLIECPECKKKNYSNYLRYLEPCEGCGHNIDWEAAKIKH